MLANFQYLNKWDFILVKSMVIRTFFFRIIIIFLSMNDECLSFDLYLLVSGQKKMDLGENVLPIFVEWRFLTC